MITREPFPWKHFFVWVLLIASGLLTAYIVFLGAVSVWIGLSNRQEDGFFMPILAGCLAILAVFWFFLRISRFLFSRTKEKGMLER